MKASRYRHIRVVDSNSPEFKSLHEYCSDPFLFSASTAAKLFGLSGGTSAKKLYELYVGLKTETHNEFDRKAMDHGNLNEPYGLAKFYQQMPHYVGVKPGMIMHKSCDWLGATPDNLSHNTITDELVNIEVKCPFSAEIPQHPSDVNQSYIVQVMVQMACIEQSSYSYLVYYKKDEFAIFKIERCQVLEDAIINSIHEFKDLVMNRTPPKIGAFTARRRLGELWGSVCITKVGGSQVSE